MATEVDQHPVPVSALDAFVEVLGEADAGASRDHFYGRLCEVICRLGSMRRAVLFRYDEAARRVRAAGAHGIDLQIFEHAHANVESAAIARRALEADQVVDTLPPWFASAALTAVPTGGHFSTGAGGPHFDRP